MTDKETLRQLGITPEEDVLMTAFGIGHEIAEDITKTIGLGNPKTAFALGVQTALKKMVDSGIMDIGDIERFIEEYEEGKKKEKGND
jgi:DNA-directed RNA polymerase subunit L